MKLIAKESRPCATHSVGALLLLENSSWTRQSGTRQKHASDARERCLNNYASRERAQEYSTVGEDEKSYCMPRIWRRD